MFPAAFLEELRKDWQLLGSLSPMTLAIQTPAKKLDDTTLQLGGETFAAARTIYSATKTPSANAALRKARPMTSRNAAAEWPPSCLSFQETCI